MKKIIFGAVLFCLVIVFFSEAYSQVKTPAEGLDQMGKDVQFHQERFKNWPRAFVLYGQIKLPRGVKEKQVVTPASIHKGGYFSIVCFSKDAKVPFLLHGQHPIAVSVDGVTQPQEELVHTPEPQYVTERVGVFVDRVRNTEKAPAFNVGVVNFAPMTPREGVRVQGSVKISKDGVAKRAIQPSVEFVPVYAPTRDFFPQPLRVEANQHPPVQAKVGTGGDFGVVLSPCIYHVRVTAKGAQPKSLYVDLSDQREFDLGLIELEEREVVINSINMELVNIPSGQMMEITHVDHTFYAATDENRDGEYLWPRYVEFPNTLYCGVTEVTVAQFQCVMKGRPVPRLEVNGMPQTGITFEMAEEFCKKLSDKKEEIAAGRRYRLPTEAEWVYVLQGGYHWYPWPKGGSKDYYNLGNSAYGGGRGQKMAYVKSYDPNPYGVYDLIGNASELTRDMFWPPEPELGYTLKGGSYSTPFRTCVDARSPSGAETHLIAHNNKYPLGASPSFRIICEIE